MRSADSYPIHVTEADRIELCSRSVDSGNLTTIGSIAADGAFHDCVCPHCRRDLSMKVSVVRGVASSRPRRPPPSLAKYEAGYVALIYGSAPAYFVGALVTGWSLSQHTKLPLQCRILLCTEDVPKVFTDLLSSVWTIRPVEYINKASPWFYWDYHKSRFKQVFTKLRILECLYGTFRKVVMLDVDLLIRGQIDSLFGLPAPAAMVRGQNNLRHGECVPLETFYTSHRQVLGINCGVMLVEPSKNLFSRMLKEVESHYHPEHWPSHGPEQDYLSRFFNAFGQWTNMSCRFNYQVHLNQLGSLEWHHLNVKSHPNVSIFHFSGQLVKPWSLLLDLHIAHGKQYAEVEEFISEIASKAERELVQINLELAAREGNEGDKLHEVKDSCEQKKPIETHFCYGLSPSATKTRRCYLDRHIHPSWTRADSDSAIEWIRAFRQADGGLNGKVVSLLSCLWKNEELARTDLL